jgi:hypothetical protein
MTQIQSSIIREASGICRSYRLPDRFVVHNDSGNTPTLYYLKDDGVVLDSKTPIQTATDTEDCASADVGGVPYIVLADVGDNNCARLSYRIYVVNELTYSVFSINFKYPDGKKRNCEACYLTKTGVIVLVTKNYPSLSGPTQVFYVMSVLSGASSTTVIPGPVLPSTLGTITGADCVNGWVVLLGNGRAHIYKEGNWLDKIQEIVHPKLYQPEGICFDFDARSLLIVSEANRTGTTLNSEIIRIATGINSV